MFDDLDIAEIAALCILGGIGIIALFKAEGQITNTAVSLIGGYLAKGVKNGVTQKPAKIPEVPNETK